MSRTPDSGSIYTVAAGLPGPYIAALVLSDSIPLHWLVGSRLMKKKLDIRVLKPPP